MSTQNPYPIPTYRYLVRVGDEEMAFNSVSGLEISSETIEYKDNTSDGVFHMPGQNVPLNISLKNGIVMGHSQLYNWFSSIQLKQVEKKDISISLTNETGSAALVTWNITNAYPTKLTAPSFNATNNDVSIGELCLLADSLTVTFH